MPADLDPVITAALSAEADSLTIPEWTEDTVSVRPPARRRSWTALGVAAVVVAIAVTGTVLATRAPHKHIPTAPGTAVTYALPSNGWKPGDGTRDAAFFGPFHAALIDGHACAWLGNIQEPALWPAGWRVRFNPTELIDPDGHVFAREGDLLHAAGGMSVVPTECGGDSAASLTGLAHGR
jgi:hypothetical protein